MKMFGLTIVFALMLASPATAATTLTPAMCSEMVEPFRQINQSMNNLLQVLKGIDEPEINGEVGEAFQRHKISRLSLITSLNEYNASVSKLEYALKICANPNLY